MSDKKFTFVLLGKVQTICNSIKNYFNISYNESIELLYNSKLYRALEDEDNKMWYYSSYDLFNMFLEETKTGTYTVYGG